MNATRWTSLTGFIHYLAKAGYCRVDETEKGWFIAWIDKSAKTLAQQEAIQRQERMKRDQEDVERQMIEEQIKRSREMFDDGRGESHEVCKPFCGYRND